MNKKYLALVSGGPDSMCLLDLYKEHIVGVIHINYKKRSSSDRDQAYVETYCKNHNIDCYSFVVTNEMYQNTKQKNFQSFARQIRINFTKEIAKKLNCFDILLGHQKDDFIETALFQTKRQSDVDYKGLRKENKINSLVFHRPLLHLWKAETEQYCQEKNISYGIDETNFSTCYTRNKIRQDLKKLSIKEKEDLYQKFVSENKKKEKAFDNYLNKYEKWEMNKFHRDDLISNTNEVQKKLIYYFLSKNNISNLSKNKIESILEGLNNKKPFIYRLENNLFLICNKQTTHQVIIQKQEKA